MPPEWTAAQISAYDQWMSATDAGVTALVEMLIQGTGTRGERQTVLDILAYIRREHDEETLGNLLIAAVRQIRMLEREVFARDGADRFEVLDRVRPRGSGLAGGAGDSCRRGTVVAVLPGEVGFLLDREDVPGDPASRYLAMSPELAAHHYERTGDQAELAPDALAVLDGVLPADRAAAARARSAELSSRNRRPAGGRAQAPGDGDPGPGT